MTVSEQEVSRPVGCRYRGSNARGNRIKGQSPWEAIRPWCGSVMLNRSCWLDGPRSRLANDLPHGGPKCHISSPRPRRSQRRQRIGWVTNCLQASITTRPLFARDTQTSISSSPSTVRPRRSTSPASTLTLQVPQNPCWHEYAVVGSRSSMTSSADRFAGTLSTRCERASSSSNGTPSTTGGGLNRS